MPGRFEELWAHESPEGGFVISCLPFFANDPSFGDLVAVSHPGFQVSRVLKRAGLRTFRGCLSDRSLSAQHHEPLHARLKDLGFPFEWHGSSYFAVLLRGFPDQTAVIHAFEAEVGAGILHTEIAPEQFPAPAET